MKAATKFFRQRWPVLFCAGVLLAISPWGSQAGVREDLELLRNRCLYFSIGPAPNDVNTVTLRHGLYAQSPFSDPGEIDLAASGFALAALPSAVECGLVASNAAKAIATNAAWQALTLAAKSAAATNLTDYGRYGYKGLLYHYYVWNDGGAEFRSAPGAEVSSIDTVLLMYGLLVCAQYFGEPVMTNYTQARDKIAWTNWLDRVSSGNSNQFYMSYMTNTGLSGHWDWRSDETALICVFAAMSDTNLDARVMWNAWTRDPVTYISPAPTSETFACYASWNGDPFTDFYGLAFLDTGRFPPDFNGIDWFDNNQTSYKGHVEFFKKERGYLDNMTFAFVAGASNPIADPKSDGAAPAVRTDCSLYSLAGGLPFYSPAPESNEIAKALSSLITNAPGADLFGWHGWPVETVAATSVAHGVANNAIVGQDICSIALSIDNYLTNRIQNIALRDARLRHALNVIWPAYATTIRIEDHALLSIWEVVPFSTLWLREASYIIGPWTEDATPVTVESTGTLGFTNQMSETMMKFYGWRNAEPLSR